MWQQAYFVNDKFWKPGSDAPIFLCVGGEGPPLDGSAVVSSVHCNVAVEWLAEKKALMFALEHRYYGCHNMSACPVSDFSAGTSALKFLSSRQAVEDVAHFVQTMNDLYGLKHSNKWISWGGSYPGMMAGFSHLKHPELIHAAVASSAPVHAKIEMEEYLDHVAYAYTVSNNDVGGSSECKDAIRTSHKWIEDRFKTKAGIAEVEKKFDVTLKTDDDLISFGGFGAANFPSQSNDPLCTQPACNIKKICAIMTDGSLGDEVSRLVKLRKVQRGQEMLPLRARLQSRLMGQVQSLPDFWDYQTCTEFGFYQTCDTGSDCPFVRGMLTLDWYIKTTCEKYGITKAEVEKNIEATNAHYGGLKPTGPDGKLGSCVMWPNGEVDPWSTLSVLDAPSKEQPVLYVDGASHHAWTHPSQAGDQPSVVKGRATIRKQVESFLAQENCGASQAMAYANQVIQVV